jgi:hypothetical protein
MDQPQRPSSSVEQRRPRSNPNVFADEYASDTPNPQRAYRRSQPASFASSTAHEEPELSTRADRSSRPRTPVQALAPGLFPVNKHGERSEPDPRWRSSIAKETPRSLEVLDERSTSNSRPESVYSESEGIPLRNRPVSSASSYAPSPYDRSSSVFPGSNGPSHPYGMFPQAGEVGAASSSGVATPSPSRSRTNNYTPAQPAHPYGLYQQNTLPMGDDGDEEARPQPAIQIGFPGRPTDFVRQRGPDGEDQYILGPDGHTEELPPYSKYPEHGTEKLAIPQIITPATAVPQSQPQSQTQPQPSSSRSAPESQEDLISASPTSPIPTPTPRRQTSPVLDRPPSETHTTQSSRSSIMTEKKTWREKTWKEKRRTRLCGGRVPVWALMLAASVVLFLVIVLGGVIGGLLTAEKGDK